MRLSKRLDRVEDVRDFACPGQRRLGSSMGGGQPPYRLSLVTGEEGVGYCSLAPVLLWKEV